MTFVFWSESVYKIYSFSFRLAKWFPYRDQRIVSSLLIPCFTKNSFSAFGNGSAPSNASFVKTSAGVNKGPP